MTLFSQNLTKLNKKSFTFEDTTPHFLFITDNIGKVEKLDNWNTRNRIIKNFEEAKDILVKATSKTLPDLIIIAIKLNFFDLNSFKDWINKNLLYNIPIIYNDLALNSLEIKNLFHLKLIDDVIKDSYDLKILEYKSNFFKALNMLSKANENKKEKRKNTIKPFLRVHTKRLIDIFISFTGIILIAPFLIIIAIIIKLTSKGPAVYKSQRAGQGFKVFGFYKFRTMVFDADKKVDDLKNQSAYCSINGKNLFFKMENDPRITKIGSFLRNTSLDELPQLFNVLKGDMSLVGNRPLPLYEANSLTTGEWAERFMAPAGITGLWQISKRGKANMSNEERIFLDIDYARKNSLRRDLKILVSTPSALIQKQNH